jgi:hypothetical protein
LASYWTLSGKVTKKMFIRLEGVTAEHVQTAGRDIEFLIRSWEHETAITADTITATDLAGDDKTLDPVAVTALMLSIPQTVLDVVDLADRIQKRRRAKELIDQAQQLATQQVTTILVSQPHSVELASLTPDELLETLDGTARTD